jgi:hypothetical protein
MGTGGSSTGGKVRPGRDADHSLSSTVEVNKKRDYISFPPIRLSWRVAGRRYSLQDVLRRKASILDP